MTQIKSLAGMIGGLVTQAEQAATQGRYAWPLYDNPDPDAAIPPAHCWRSVGQRTLSHPISWGAQIALIPYAPNYIGTLVPLGLPVLPVASPPVVPLPITESAPFYDNNDQTERGGIDGLVLIGLRAKMVVGYGGKRPSNVTPFRKSNEWAEAIPDFASHYLSFRITHTAGERDQWVNDTPMRYINRKDGGFVATPPLIWNTRDTTASWVTRPPDFNSSVLPTPALEQFGGGNPIPIQVYASLLVEGLFVPDPDRCDPDIWPGLWCPTQAIQGHRDYDPDFYRWRRKRLAGVIDSLAGVTAPRLSKTQIEALRQQRRSS